MATQQIRFTVDNKEQSIEVQPNTLLVQLLRDDLDITSVNLGCDTSQCGACTIELNGSPVKSCSLLAVQANGSNITTAAGISEPGTLSELQQSFQNCHGLQCGFCTPGMLMTAREILRQNPAADREEIRAGLRGNLCRCTGYQNIVDAIHQVSLNHQERTNHE